MTGVLFCESPESGTVPGTEMERKPEVPASTQDEAFSIAAKPEESREARPKSTVCLTSQRHPGERHK